MENISLIIKTAIEDLSGAGLNKSKINSIIIDLKSLSLILKNEVLLKTKLEINDKKISEFINKLKKPSKLEVGGVSREWRMINLLGELRLILEKFIIAIKNKKDIMPVYSDLMDFLSEDRELNKVIRNI